MKNSQQYPIGTIFRKVWSHGDLQEFKIIGYQYDIPLMRMEYLGNTSTGHNNPDILIRYGFEVILPKSGNFDNLYNKLNESR